MIEPVVEEDLDGGTSAIRSTKSTLPPTSDLGNDAGLHCTKRHSRSVASGETTTAPHRSATEVFEA
jgi:hypothetical protein